MKTQPEIFDRDFYAVRCWHDGTAYFAELTDAQASDLDSIIAGIASGQIENVTAVFQFNPVENFSRDVSEDVARKIIGKYLDDDGDVEGPALDFLEDHLGCRAVAEAVREHAR